jgi:hypothetical protein
MKTYNPESARLLYLDKSGHKCVRIDANGNRERILVCDGKTTKMRAIYYHEMVGNFSRTVIRIKGKEVAVFPDDEFNPSVWMPYDVKYPKQHVAIERNISLALLNPNQLPAKLMNKVLIMHHVEPMWQNAMRQKGVIFDNYLADLWHHIDNSDYDQLILTQFEDCKLQDMHLEFGFGELCIDCYEYAYGWTFKAFEDCPEEYIEGGSHSESVYIPQWLVDLKGKDVYLCGAFDGECIEDMEIALRHCVGKFTRINSLII